MSFPNINGAGRYVTERDADFEADAAVTRDMRWTRWRDRQRVEDGIAILYSCGCVAAIKQTQQDAREHVDRRDLTGTTMVAARAGFDGPRLRVWRLPDGLPLPLPALDGCDQHGGDA